MILPDGKTVTSPLSFIYDQFATCKKCTKAKRTFLSGVALIVNAVLTAAVAGMIFLIVAQEVKIEPYRVENMLRLPMIAGAAAYLWWIYWQYEKIFCECDEERM